MQRISFPDRIKKEMTEGIIRALLEDANYRVIDSGIEKVIREISCLSYDGYMKLGFANAMRHLPDFTVMNEAQDEKHMVEVKYRKDWDKRIFEKIKEQVRLFDITLISVNADPPIGNSDPDGPARFIRACRLKFEHDIYKVETKRTKNGPVEWVHVEGISDENLWWKMRPLQELFPAFQKRKDDQSLTKAVRALQGILDN